jgi:ABC-type phosphate/phosphonate transport system substrate-binding protein
MIAHLSMYDVPEANAALWSAIRAELGYGPETLSLSNDFWQIWRDPDLLFAQTCGYPFRARLHPDVRLIGTPDYGLPDCPPGYYRSLFIKRAGDPRGTLAAMDGARFAYNEPLSQSGWAAPVSHMLRLGPRPGALLETGAHAASLAAVLAGEADFAGLDAMSWTLFARKGATEGAEIFAQTDPSPGLPYITGPKGDPETLFTAVSKAIAVLPEPTRAALHLRGLVRIPAADYLAVPTPLPPDAIL